MADPTISETTVDRRGFLAGAAGLPTLAAVGAVLGSNAHADDPVAPAVPGMITRTFQPRNLEMPLSSMGDFITPTSRFFIRSHFPVPKGDAGSWKLTVDGAVERPMELSLAELKSMTSVTMPLTMECAGNGRAFLVPRAQGLLWEQGAVGTAEWTGIRLAELLGRTGVKPGAVEVVLEGADRGEVTADPRTPGVIAFERSLPLDKAMRPETLLAWGMNGADLTPDHGFPLRAVVGGWYGMASIKWLTRITVVDRPFGGYWQTMDYSRYERRGGRPTLVPLGAMEVKSAIARPALLETLPAGKPYRVSGTAWAGEPDIVKVELSVDGGTAWAEAKLLGEAKPWCWRPWEWTWNVPTTAGRYQLLARATDRTGRVQPVKHDPDRRTYLISHSHPIEVEVR
jgi:DMSO/TMAO reductase YedYZ molybdopterin-dependent catalytic subunit